MLTTLTIRNLAIIEQLTLDFSAGFTALTGETGAGKSILIDALGLLLGGRADSQLVRDGCERAEVTGIFSMTPESEAHAWLASHELVDLDAPDQLVLRRVVLSEGRTRAFVNGQPVNAAPLRDLGALLVEIFGQSESQTLLRTEIQRQQLDAFADHGNSLATVSRLADEIRALDARAAALRSAGPVDPAQLDFLRYQVNELAALDLRPESLQQLEHDHRRLAHADQLLAEGGLALDLLYAGDNSASARLGEAVARLTPMAGLDSDFESVLKLADGAEAHLAEAADSLRHLLDRLEIDPAQLAETERRVAAVHDLARKHRCKASELDAQRTRLQQQLADTEGAESTLVQLAETRDATLKRYRKAAAGLSTSRREAADRLAREATGLIRQLGMPNARFGIAVEPAADDEVKRHGLDDVRFDFSANPGQAPRPLAKVASGGELSRISLALQVVLTQDLGADTLIFDEVDAGISGGVAEIVGQQLRALGRQRQVMSVTHLAQVAAQAMQHVGIRKEVRGSQTFTTVQMLSPDQRVEELARMQGGVAISERAREHARELLQRAGD